MKAFDDLTRSQAKGEQYVSSSGQTRNNYVSSVAPGLVNLGDFFSSLFEEKIDVIFSQK